LENKPTERVVEVKNKKITLAAIFIVVFLSLIFFGSQAFSEATYKYYSVFEVKNTKEVQDQNQIGLKGILVSNTYVRSADGLSATFNLKDKDNDNSIKVNYSGEIGSVFFNEYSELIMQGYFESKDYFIATNLSVRCPSKYQTDEDYA
jgi:cytochrome c-type biogenesis protein CcmE|tara:strand:+ start:5573 stop:6016 length:444 start_codon:yes stop_codon:yes gene_type:complete